MKIGKKLRESREAKNGFQDDKHYFLHPKNWKYLKMPTQMDNWGEIEIGREILDYWAISIG